MVGAASTAGHASRADYLERRRRFTPERPQLVIVAESPPVSGRYFYNASGRPTEPLFAALMRQLGVSLPNKEAGLREFQRRGWILVDATYEPVNGLRPRQRDQVILRDYPLLRSDLEGLLVDRSTPIVLIKANVCRILEPKLVQDGMNVLNRGRKVYFPGSGQQRKFHEQFAPLLRAGD